MLNCDEAFSKDLQSYLSYRPVIYSCFFNCLLIGHDFWYVHTYYHEMTRATSINDETLSVADAYSPKWSTLHATVDDSALTSSESEEKKSVHFQRRWRVSNPEICFCPNRAFYLEKSNLPTDSNTTAMKIDQVNILLFWYISHLLLLLFMVFYH